MPGLIVKLEKPGEEPRYMEWSTVSGAPRTYGMTLAEFKDYYIDEYGGYGYETDFARRMKKVEETGCSSWVGDTLATLMANYKHGDLPPLTFDSLWRKYVERSEEDVDDDSPGQV